MAYYPPAPPVVRMSGLYPQQVILWLVVALVAINTILLVEMTYITYQLYSLIQALNGLH